VVPFDVGLNAHKQNLRPKGNGGIDMSKYYRGFWSFAPLPEYTTHMVEANNEDEAIAKLGVWACEHKNCVDEPWDFEVEELDNAKLELAQKIVTYDPHSSEYDDSIWKVYEATTKPKVSAEMAREYVGDLKRQQDIVEDFQTYTPRQRAVAEDARSKIITILRLIREITMKVA
jgi:hypothetical protein